MRSRLIVVASLCLVAPAAAQQQPTTLDLMPVPRSVTLGDSAARLTLDGRVRDETRHPPGS